MAADKSIPVVAPRNDPAALEPYRKSQATKIAGQRPGFTYQWCRPEELDTKLRRHEIGSQHTGYLMVDPWEVVAQDKIELPGPGMPSAGKSTDTTVNNGELILLCTPDENAAKYARIEQEMDKLIDRRLSTGESHSFGDTSFKTRTAGDRGQKVSVNKLLDGVQ
jgi:hypothetical protein